MSNYVKSRLLVSKIQKQADILTFWKSVHVLVKFYIYN